MSKYGRSVWLERYPRARVPSYPKLRQKLVTDVAIVGAGLTGCAAAYAFAAAGVKVALVDAGQVGQGSSAATFGWIADTPAFDFLALERAVGVRTARRAWQIWRRAALDFGALLRRLDAKCGVESRPSLLVARTPEQTTRLKREAKARRDGGLDATLPSARAAGTECGFAVQMAIRSRDGAVVDPYRAALALAAAAVARGAAIFERSPVERIRFSSKSVEATTAHASITAERVVVATGVPTKLIAALERHVKSQRAYFALTEPIPAKIRRTLGSLECLTTDMATPPHTIRWIDEERLFVCGADGPVVSDHARAKTVVQRTGQLMYELSMLYPDISGIAPALGWDATYGCTVDGLPYIGPHRNLPHHLFAFNGNGQSLTEAYLASRILLRHHLGEADAADEVFGFARGRENIR
jgi:glycine/D-amino acid oxidase-like deaminating enzyme